MYDKFKKLKTHHQLIWSLIIATALVSVWRGIWGLMDLFIFPSSKLISVITSLTIGIIIFIVIHYKLK
jgi:hypothetical protein